MALDYRPGRRRRQQHQVRPPRPLGAPIRVRSTRPPSEVDTDAVGQPALRSSTCGKETGEFIAVDTDNGKIVWEFQTGSGINAMPVTYTHQGRQYVTVLSGIGGLYWNIWREQLKDTVAQGGSVWTFALLPE
jgi:outer membrane protein assembly factor BamB